MSRRLMPYVFAGLFGVVSGVYIFRPVFEETVATSERRSATGTVKSPDKPVQSDTAPRLGQ